MSNYGRDIRIDEKKWRKKITISPMNECYSTDLPLSTPSFKKGSMNAMLTLAACSGRAFTLLNIRPRVTNTFMALEAAPGARYIKTDHVMFAIGEFKIEGL